MPHRYDSFLKAKLESVHFDKLMALENPKLRRFVADAIEMCRPDSIYVCTDDPDDVAYIRRRAVETGEEASLGIHGHTLHFDGPTDQARAREVDNLRAAGKITLPSSLGAEKASNPFLRTREHSVVTAARRLDPEAAPGISTMAAIRAWKDRF